MIAVASHLCVGFVGSVFAVRDEHVPDTLAPTVLVRSSFYLGGKLNNVFRDTRMRKEPLVAPLSPERLTWWLPTWTLAGTTCPACWPPARSGKQGWWCCQGGGALWRELRSWYQDSGCFFLRGHGAEFVLHLVGSPVWTEWSRTAQSNGRNTTRAISPVNILQILMQQDLLWPPMWRLCRVRLTRCWCWSLFWLDTALCYRTSSLCAYDSLQHSQRQLEEALCQDVDGFFPIMDETALRVSLCKNL